MKDEPIGHDKVRHFYDDQYYREKPVRQKLPWHVQLIASRLGVLQGKQVLDIACGTGEWLAAMARRGAHVAGVEISARAAEQCRVQLPQSEIHEGVAEQLPFVDGRFDLVSCLGSLEHFLDQPKALCEMRRVAKPDARFLILVPNAGFLTRRLGLYRGTQQVAIRETVRPIAEWEEMLENAGLEIMDRWRDLRPFGVDWITSGPALGWPLRAAQAVALAVWPLRWQYQVYFHCRARSSEEHAGAVAAKAI